MAEVYVATNSPTKTKIFYGGEIRDADGDVTATIFDITEDPAITPPINPSQVILTLTAIKEEQDFGSYKINIPNSISVRQRNLKVRWYYEIDGNEIYHDTYVDVITPYCSLAEAIEDLNFGTDQSDPNYKTYHDLVMAEKYARKAIENYTGQKFSLYDDVQIVYGAGSDILPLPFKINDLHELYGNDILLINTFEDINNLSCDVEISQSGFALKANRANMIDNVVYTANGLVPPSINYSDGGIFSKNVAYRVQGRYGWKAVPDEIEIACIELMKDYFAKDSTWRNKYVHSVQSFDWHFEYNQEAYRGTGNVYVDQLLLPYVLTQLVVI